MKKSKKHSILFRKYFFMISSIVLVSYLVLVAAFIGTYVYNYVGEKEHTLLANAETVAEQVERYFAKESLDSFDESKSHIPAFVCDTIFQLSKATGSNSDIFICNINGRVVLCKEMMRNGMAVSNVNECDIHRDYCITLKTIQHVCEHIIGDYGVGTLDNILSEKCVIASKPIFIDNEFKGIVFAVQPLKTSLGGSVFNILRLLLIAGALALITAFVGAYNIATQLTKPLAEMSKAVKSYANGDFSVRIPIRRQKDELNQLSVAINAMAQSLSVSEASSRSFVANVSHELRTPMTTIGGFIDGILDGTIPPEKEKYYLNIVSAEVKRLTNLVVSMLNLSKIEAGKVKIHYDNFNLSSMIVTTLLSFEKKIEENSIEVLGLDLFDNVFVNADKGMINQVIYNYIDNAVKFTPENGTISFRMEKIDDKIWVFIRNSGNGISSENLSRVFERFYKVDSSRSYDIKGTGLGLYIVKTIVELHGGMVAAESVEGKYAEFSFCLPI